METKNSCSYCNQRRNVTRRGFNNAVSGRNSTCREQDRGYGNGNKSGCCSGCGVLTRRADNDTDGRSNCLGCACRQRDSVDSQCHSLMNQLQKIDFSIQETVLYLNAYPDCQRALEHYRQLVKQRCALVEKYQERCGDLTNRDNGDRDTWDWVEGAWPWHPDFPGNRRA